MFSTGRGDMTHSFLKSPGPPVNTALATQVMKTIDCRLIVAAGLSFALNRCFLVVALAIAAGGGQASAAALSAADQAQLREAHAAEKVYTGESNTIRGEAMQLARKLGQQNDVDTAVFFLELGDRSMFYAFVESWKAPATPELEVQVIKHLHDAELHTCSSALLLRQYVLRVTYDALLDAIRARSENAEYCTRAIVRTEMSGIEAGVTTLLPLLEDYYARSAIATFLVERKYQPAEPELIAWLLRTSDRAAGSAAWIIVKLDTPGMVDALAKRLAMLKGAPGDAQTESTVTDLSNAILYATPQVKMDRSLLSPEVVSEFPSASRDKIVAMLKRRGELEAMSDDPNATNLAYWISQHKNEQVKASIAAGVDLNAIGKSSGDRALHVAVKYSNLDALRMLLDAGADPNGRNWMGNTPLKELSGRKAFDDSLDATNLTAARLLLAKGADPSLPSKDTMTPLHLATAKNFFAMVKILVEGGASINAEADELGIHGITPTLIADDHDYKELSVYLRSKGGRVNHVFVAKRAAQRVLTIMLTPFLHMH